MNSSAPADAGMAPAAPASPPSVPDGSAPRVIEITMLDGEPLGYEPSPPVLPPSPPVPVAREHNAMLLWGVAAFALAAVATVIAILLWQRLSTIQEQLARQNLEAGNQAVEAKTVAKQAHEQAAESSTRVAVLEGRVAELTAQRAQVDALLQAASRSVDDSLVADLEASLRMAQEQAQLTGSASPLLAGLQSAQRRVVASTVPDAARLQRAFAADIARIKATPSTDATVVLTRLDELIRLVDQVPTLHDPNDQATRRTTPQDEASGRAGWLGRALDAFWQQLRSLVRVSDITTPEAALLTPDQGFYLRASMKQRLLNARMGMLARQPDAVRGDLAGVADLLNRYFDPAARQTQQMAGTLQQMRTEVTQWDVPRIDDSLAALASASGK